MATLGFTSRTAATPQTASKQRATDRQLAIAIANFEKASKNQTLLYLLIQLGALEALSFEHLLGWSDQLMRALSDN